MSQSFITPIDELFEELDGGTFGKRLATAMADSALGVVATGDRKKKGKVTVTFDISQIGESNQVQIDHTIEFRKPTHRGSQSEVHTTASVMYVGTRGALTVLANDNRDMFKKEAEEA